MKKLIILFVFVLFATVGCADNMDTVPQPVTPELKMESDDPTGGNSEEDTTPEEEEDKPIRPRRPKTT